MYAVEKHTNCSNETVSCDVRGTTSSGESGELSGWTISTGGGRGEFKGFVGRVLVGGGVI